MSERWEIIVLKFEVADTATGYINGEIAKCPGYEPFDSYWRVENGVEKWHLLLRRRVES